MIKGWRERASCTGAWGPHLCPEPTGQGVWRKQNALPPASTLLSEPPPQTYTDSENGRQTEKELCLKSENVKRQGRQHSVFLNLASNFEMLKHWPLLSIALRMTTEAASWKNGIECPFYNVYTFPLRLKSVKRRNFCILRGISGNTDEMVKSGKEQSLIAIQALMFASTF